MRGMGDVMNTATLDQLSNVDLHRLNIGGAKIVLDPVFQCTIFLFDYRYSRGNSIERIIISINVYKMGWRFISI